MARTFHCTESQQQGISEQVENITKYLRFHYNYGFREPEVSSVTQHQLPSLSGAGAAWKSETDPVFIPGQETFSGEGQIEGFPSFIKILQSNSRVLILESGPSVCGTVLFIYQPTPSCTGMGVNSSALKGNLGPFSAFLCLQHGLTSPKLCQS